MQLTKDYNCIKKTIQDQSLLMFTPEQRFFISWTTVWRTKSRDAYQKIK
jgi:predicted metalloendopeptidase